MAVIRRASPDDALGLAIVNVYTWKTAYAGLLPDSVLDGRISDLRQRAAGLREPLSRGAGFVAVEAGTVVGFCLYGPSRNPDYPGAGELYALYVLKGFEGLGLGRALMAAGAAALGEAGTHGLILNCLRGNPALGFYRRLGGSVVGERRDALENAEIVEDILFFDEPAFMA